MCQMEVLDAMRTVAKKLGLPDSVDELWDLFVDRDGLSGRVVFHVSVFAPVCGEMWAVC